MFIPDPNFSLPDIGSRVKQMPDAGTGSKGSLLLGPLGSGFVIICTDLDLNPDPFINKKKNE
jgi:hypothetical protein